MFEQTPFNIGVYTFSDRYGILDVIYYVVFRLLKMALHFMAVRYESVYFYCFIITN